MLRWCLIQRRFCLISLSLNKKIGHTHHMAMEELPSDMPESHGQSMTMRVFVDADHAGDLVT